MLDFDASRALVAGREAVPLARALRSRFGAHAELPHELNWRPSAHAPLAGSPDHSYDHLMHGGMCGSRRPQSGVPAALVLFACVLGAALPSTSSAAVEKGLLFETSGDLTIAWDDLKKKPVEIGVCNSGAKTVAGVRAQLVGSTLKVATKGTPTANVKLDAPTRLAAGDCADITLSALDPPDSSAFLGNLLVTSAGAGAVRRALSVSGPGYLPPGTLKAARDKTPFTASHRPWPWEDSQLNGTRLALRETDATTAPAELLKPGKFVGHIYKDGFAAAVKIAGKPSAPENGQFSVPIKVEGADHVGTYSGSLDLTGGTKDADRIPITVAVKDSWGWAVLAIALGVIAGLIPILLRRWRSIGELKRKRDGLAQKYLDAEEALPKPPVPADLTAPAAASNLKKYLDKFNKSLSAYRRGALALDRKDKGYVQLLKMIEDAESDADTISDVNEGLGPALGTLRTALDKLDEFLRSEDWSRYPPPFRKSAWDLLAGGELPVGGAAALTKRALAAAELSERWENVARQVSRIEEWAAALMLDLADMSASDQALLASARAAGATAHEELLHVTVDAGVKPDTAAAVHGAHGNLTYLAERYAGRRDETQSLAVVFNQSQLNLIGTIREGRRGLNGPETIDPESRTLPELPEPVRAVISKGWRLLLDGGIVLSALAVAVVTALSSFYFGKTWGTTADYVTVILIGTGSQVVVKALTDSLSGIGGSGDTAELEKAKSPASTPATDT